MRYTTIIDISEQAGVYRNKNARLIYVHLALKSGYHDDDRDEITISIRALAAAAGCTFSATRHALAQLEAAELIARRGDRIIVKKWVLTKEITSRTQEAAKATARRAADSAAQEREKEQRRLENTYRRRTREQADEELIETYERFLRDQEEGHLGPAGLGFLAQNKSKYDELKKSK